MNLEDYKYHNYPSSLIRKYGVYTLDEGKQGIDKYYFNLNESYVHNYLDSKRFQKIDLIFPKKKLLNEEPSKNQENTNSIVEDTKKLPFITEPNNEQKPKILKKIKIISNKSNKLQSTQTKVKDKIYGSPENQKFTKINLSSVMSPIHHCRKTQSNLFFSSMGTPRYKDNYYKETSKLIGELLSPVVQKKKMDSTLGFTSKMIPSIRKSQNETRKNSPFDLYEKKQKELLKSRDYEEEKRRCAKCLNEINEGRNKLPKIRDFMNLESMKSYNVKSYNKYMGEKYNPHNYKIDSYCQ